MTYRNSYVNVCGECVFNMVNWHNKQNTQRWNDTNAFEFLTQINWNRIRASTIQMNDTRTRLFSLTFSHRLKMKNKEMQSNVIEMKTINYHALAQMNWEIFTISPISTISNRFEALVVSDGWENVKTSQLNHLCAGVCVWILWMKMNCIRHANKQTGTTRTSSLLSNLSLICWQKTGKSTARQSGILNNFESTKYLMQIIFDWVNRPGAMFVMMSTIILLLKWIEKSASATREWVLSAKQLTSIWWDRRLASDPNR